MSNETDREAEAQKLEIVARLMSMSGLMSKFILANEVILQEFIKYAAIIPEEIVRHDMENSVEVFLDLAIQAQTKCLMLNENIV